MNVSDSRSADDAVPADAFAVVPVAASTALLPAEDKLSSTLAVDVVEFS